MEEARIRERLGRKTARLLEPLDEHNQRLVENVHPPDWPNPEPADRYHLVVIGAGSGGLVSAAGAAGLGARVALVERRLLGGDCLNYGCVPSKALIRAARAWSEARGVESRFGGPAMEEGAGDPAAAFERMRRLRAAISRHDSARRFADMGIDVFIGEGCFTGPETVEVDGAELRFRRAVVATGGRPSAPPIPGLEETGYLNNETLFTLEAPPARLAVIGAGPIGCEMSQTFARLGTEVYLIEAQHGVLPPEEDAASQIIERALASDGVRLMCCGKEIEVSKKPDGTRRINLESHEESYELEIDEILVAAGRAPNIESLGLEAAGIEATKHGIEVNDRLQTTNKKVFAVGDVASRYKFTHMADAMARIVIQNALFFGRAKASDLVVPWCTYTSPEVAHVGLYERQAEEEGEDVQIIEIDLEEVDRAVLDGATEGYLRLVVKEGSDEILGATLVAENAGDIISEITLAMTAGVGLGEISSTIHPYPTQAEVVRKAADQWRRGKLTPFVQKLFGLWFRIFG